MYGFYIEDLEDGQIWQVPRTYRTSEGALRAGKKLFKVMELYSSGKVSINSYIEDSDSRPKAIDTIYSSL